LDPDSSQKYSGLCNDAIVPANVAQVKYISHFLVIGIGAGGLMFLYPRPDQTEQGK